MTSQEDTLLNFLANGMCADPSFADRLLSLCTHDAPSPDFQNMAKRARNLLATRAEPHEIEDVVWLAEELIGSKDAYDRELGRALHFFGRRHAVWI